MFASRVSLAAALATALLAGTAPAPASAASVATAGSLPAARTCSALATATIYTYYSDMGYSTVVGYGELDCDGNFSMLSGYHTQWFRTKTAACPY
jgi:hypothetical protein